MPFDGTDFGPIDPERPKKPAASDTAVCVGIAVLAVALLLTPVSVFALVDIIKFLRGS